MIPVSFLITINDQFQECLYELTTHNEKILEIIDTIGFGDTRGQNQDEKNLNEISSYIQNLTHLNASCSLLKPNVRKLYSSFKSSVRHILHCLR